MPDHKAVASAQALRVEEVSQQRAAFRRALAGIAAAVLASTIVLLLPQPAGLSPEGKRMAAIFLTALILWTSEAIPVAVTALLVIILQPIFRVEDLRTALNSFISPVFFFVIAMFCIAEAITSSGLDRRFGHWLLSRAGTDSRRALLAIMVGTAAISTIMSDVPTCAIFMAIALGLFAKMKLEPGTSRFAKAVMIGVPIASLIGGVGTPAGSSVNILGLHFIEQYGKIRVPFLHWMAIGMPMVVVLVPLAWWVLVRCFPPEIKTITELADLDRERAKLGPLGPAQKKVILIISSMMVLWILSTWISQLDVVLIGIAGAVVMFLPGIEVINWKQAERGIGWDTLLMIGGVTSLGAACVETGLAKWLVDAALGEMRGWSPFWAVAVISAFTVVIHLLLPIGPVVNAVIIPPISLLALSAGQNPVLYGLPVAFTASCAFLLPLDAVPLITYSKGYYRMLDMFLPGAIISFFWIILMTLLIISLSPVLRLL